MGNNLTTPGVAVPAPWPYQLPTRTDCAVWTQATAGGTVEGLEKSICDPEKGYMAPCTVGPPYPMAWQLNPGLNGSSDLFWAGYHYCVGLVPTGGGEISSHAPTPKMVTVTPSTSTAGQGATTPTPAAELEGSSASTLTPKPTTTTTVSNAALTLPKSTLHRHGPSFSSSTSLTRPSTGGVFLTAPQG